MPSDLTRSANNKVCGVTFRIEIGILGSGCFEANQCMVQQGNCFVCYIWYIERTPHK